jgi:UDP-N-acetyl-D-glucosamine 4,6-dehydratase
MLFFLIADFLLTLLSLYLAYALRFNFSVPPDFIDRFGRVFFVLVVLKIGIFYIFKIYHRSWRFFSLQDFKKLFVAHSIAYILFGLIFMVFSDWFNPVPRSAIIIDFILSISILGGLRISRRVLLESSGNPNSEKAIVYGATSKTSQVIKSALLSELPYFPIAVFDSNNTVGTFIENVQVYDDELLEEIVKRENIKTALIAKDMSSKELDSLFERLTNSGIEVIKLVSLLSDRERKLKDIAIEDLLAREPKDLDTTLIKQFIKDKVVLVTGAGGSIGSEISRQCKTFGAKKLILVENSEYNLYKISEELGEDIIVPRLISVLEYKKLDTLFSEFKPQIVIHTAAYKHVPLCEANGDSAIENNILGSKNLIDIGIKHGVEKIVNISSDKAVRPTNIMGATKRVIELYAQNVPSGKTEIVSVRFGNVLGSSGSVVPKFKEQIQNGGPVTVTHPEITRYFMLIPEACQLVLQAGAMAKGGELFILDMGEPVKIVDLARKMIRLYGKEGEVEIEFTGLRPGEKLYEELLIDEAECRTKYESIYVAKPTQTPIEELRENIEELLNSDDKIGALKKIVPEFNHRD